MFFACVEMFLFIPTVALGEFGQVWAGWTNVGGYCSTEYPVKRTGHKGPERGRQQMYSSTVQPFPTVELYCRALLYSHNVQPYPTVELYCTALLYSSTVQPYPTVELYCTTLLYSSIISSVAPGGFTPGNDPAPTV
jgi:transcriptional regulator of met regulon